MNKSDSMAIGLIIFFIFFNLLLFQPSVTSRTLFPLLIAAQTVFPVALLKAQPSKWMKAVLIVIAAAAVVYLIYSKSRAAWLGLAAGLMIVAWLNGYFKDRKLFLGLCAGLIAIAFAVTLFVKTGSSKGRLLIYKVIAYNLSANDLLTGIGPGKFKAQYNLWQARYFERHDINSPEALLADNTFFAFNDHLQLVIETGAAGLVILLSTFACFFALLRKLKARNRPHVQASGAAAAIVTIATAALFSYPFQNPWIVAYMFCCLAVLLHATVNQRALKYATTAFAMVAILSFSWQGSYFNKQTQLKNKAIALARTGHRQEGLRLLKNMINEGSKDGHVFYLYAKELYLTGQMDSALIYLKQATRYICTLESSRLFAKIYEEKEDRVNAERYYLTAVRIIPNRFESRYDLVGFYMRQDDTAKAMFWANSILRLPVKVPSQRVIQIKTEANDLISRRWR